MKNEKKVYLCFLTHLDIKFISGNLTINLYKIGIRINENPND